MGNSKSSGFVNSVDSLRGRRPFFVGDIGGIENRSTFGGDDCGPCVRDGRVIHNEFLVCFRPAEALLEPKETLVDDS